MDCVPEKQLDYVVQNGAVYRVGSTGRYQKHPTRLCGNKGGPVLVGLAGRRGAGKSTLAIHLIENYGFAERQFAEPIKRALSDRFGTPMMAWDDLEWKESCDLRFGTNERGAPFSPRSWAQWLGTDVARRLFGEDVWVRYLLDKSPLPHRCVVSDVRFANEVLAIQQRGGIVLGVRRPAADEGSSQRIRRHAHLHPVAHAALYPDHVSTHISETGVDTLPVDVWLDNDGPPDVLYRRAVAALRTVFPQI